MNTSKKISAVIWANIRKFQYLENMSNDKLAVILGVSTRTLYKYDSEPCKLTFERVQSFVDDTGVQFHDLIQ